MTEDLFPSASEPVNVSRKRRDSVISPPPWSVERTNERGWRGISIKDAEGMHIAYMVMQPGRDNEMANAKAIVDAVNKQFLRSVD